jgi:hypothetical protein
MRFAEVRQFAMSLPDVTEEPHFHFASYRVRGKVFVTVPPAEEHIHIFVAGSVAGEVVTVAWVKRQTASQSGELHLRRWQ